MENESGKEASNNKKVMSLNSSCDAESGRKGLCRGPGDGGRGVAQHERERYDDDDIFLWKEKDLSTSQLVLLLIWMR